MKKANIFLNGEITEKEIIYKYIDNNDLFIAADNGVTNLENVGIEPDLVIGDLDSLPQKSLDNMDKSKILKDINQNFSDIQKCLKFVHKKKIKNVNFFNFYGKRKDHAHCNILSLLEYVEIINFKIIDNYGLTTFLKPGNNTFSFEIGKTVSLYSFNSVNQLTLSGFKYELTKKSFHNSFIGLSNKTQLSKQIVYFTKGYLIMYVPHNI